MLFILTVSSVGLPIISHECAHDNLKDVHIFSSDNHKCKDDCGAAYKISNELSFQKEPCCSFDASLYINDVLVTAKNDVKAKEFFVFVKFKTFINNALSSSFQPKTYYSNHYNKPYGLSYRISLQSFLC